MGKAKFQRYAVQERIAMGGMAEVFRARGVTAEGASIPVVLKKILPHFSENPEFRRMFMDEALITAMLDHPNVVQLYDFGRIDDQLFMALEYVEGVDLDKLLKRCRPAREVALADALYLVREVLKGLHHAHTRTSPDGKPLAIVHRDVTSANVLLSWEGAVKVTDFGIAKAAVRNGQTRAGVVKGNLRYMSPEQLTGGPIDARSDLYSVGIVLYLLLGGSQPQDEVVLSEVINRAFHGDLPHPIRLGPAIPPLLLDVVHRATRPDPEARFQSALAFLQAVESLSAGSAAAPGPRSLASFLREVFPAEAPGGVLAEPEPLTVFEKRLSALSLEPVEPQAPGEAGSSLRTAVSTPPQGEDDTEELTTAKSSPRPLAPTNPSTITTEKTARPGKPQSGEVFDAVTRPSARVLSFRDEETQSASISISVSSMRTALSRPEQPLLDEEATRKTKVARAWRALATPSRSPAPAVRELAPAARLTAHSQAVAAVSFAADGGRLITGSHDQTLRVWEPGSGGEPKLLSGHRAAVTSLAVSPDGSFALSGSRDRTLRQWSLRSFKEVCRLEGHTDWVLALAVSPDGGTALSGGLDWQVKWWDLSTRQTRRTCKGHRAAVTSVAFAGGGTGLSGSYDRTLRTWDLLHEGESSAIEVAGQGIRAVAVTPDQTLTLAAGADNVIRCWDLGSAREKGRFFGHREPVVALAVSPDGRLVASASYDATVRIWELSTGHELCCLRGHEGAVLAVAFSPDGSRLASGGSDRSVILWELPGVTT